jgi:cytochrome c oxidase assembly protein subunit 15
MTTLLRSALELRFFSSNGTLLLQAMSAQQQNQQLHVISPPTVGNWLLLSSVLILAVIVVGVVTRLTEPRLSHHQVVAYHGLLPADAGKKHHDELLCSHIASNNICKEIA